MKIVITNAVSLNGGDAAILAAEHRLLAQAFPGAEIVAVDSQAAVAARYYPEFRFEQHLYDGTRRRRFPEARRRAIRGAADRLANGGSAGLSPLLSRAARRTLAAYAEADLVVSTGGTYLVEHYELVHRFFELEMATRFGAPLVFFTQSLGPFAKPDNAEAVRAWFERAALVLLRDARSARHLTDIGVPGERLHVHGDAAFVLGDGAALERLAKRRLPEKDPKVAVSVRHWSHFSSTSADDGMRRYVEAHARLVEHLVRERDARVTFVSTCQGIPEYWTHDSRTADAIAARLPTDVRKHVVVNAEFHRPEALVELFAGYDLVVATRMHAAILSLVAGTPVLPIAYETKTSELFRSLAFGDVVLELETLTPETAALACQKLYAELDGRRPALADGVARQRTSAQGVVERLRAVPLARGGGR